MKVLVTGAAGFIGYHLCNKLLQLNYEVVGLDNINDYYDVNLKLARLNELGILKEDVNNNKGLIENIDERSFSFIKIDLVDMKSLQYLFEKNKFDIVINLAAQAGVRYSIENPHVYIQSNIVGYANILECCRIYKIKHLVYASSSSVYGGNNKIPFSEKDPVDKPVSLYAATKKSNELMAYTYSHLYKIKTTGLRFFTVYGPWGRPDMAPFLFTDAILSGKSINVFNNGNMERDFTYIDDIVDSIVKLTFKLPSKENKDLLYNIFNIGSCKPIKLMNFIKEIEKCVEQVAVKNYLEMQPGDVKKTWANTERIENFINYKPKVPLDVGVNNFIKWYKEYFTKK